MTSRCFKETERQGFKCWRDYINGGPRGMEEFLSNDGTNKGHVIFKGISLAIGAVGLDGKVLSVFEMSEWK